MILEEAIKHTEAVAKAKERETKENRNHGGWAYDDKAAKCSACAAEHRQLAEWLKKLKERREKDLQPTCNKLAKDTNVPCKDTISRQAAIDAAKHAWAKGLEPSQYIEIISPPQPEPCEDAVSRKAAVEKIRRYGVGAFDFEDYTPEQAERFVIKLLKNLPSVTPELCDDAVSRAAVIDLIEASDLDLADRVDNQAVCSFVKMIPPVTPKRKTGKWRVLKDRSSGQDFSCCNRCDHYYSANTSDWNFCPNCGAKMEG